MTCARRPRLLLCLLLLALTAGLAGACAVTPIQLPCCEGGVLAAGDARDKAPDAGSGEMAGPPPNVNDLSLGSDASVSGDGPPRDAGWSSEELLPPDGDLSVDDAGQSHDRSVSGPDKAGKPTG